MTVRQSTSAVQAKALAGTQARWFMEYRELAVRLAESFQPPGHVEDSVPAQERRAAYENAFGSISADSHTFTCVLARLPGAGESVNIVLACIQHVLVLPLLETMPAVRPAAKPTRHGFLFAEPLPYFVLDGVGRRGTDHSNLAQDWDRDVPAVLGGCPTHDVKSKGLSPRRIKNAIWRNIGLNVRGYRIEGSNVTEGLLYTCSPRSARPRHSLPGCLAHSRWYLGRKHGAIAQVHQKRSLNRLYQEIASSHDRFLPVWQIYEQRSLSLAKAR